MLLKKILHHSNERKSLLRRSHAVLPSTNLTQHITQPSGRGGASAKYGGASVKYGGGSHQPCMGWAISQVWGGSSTNYGGGHQPSMGGSSTNYGGGHQPSMGGSSTNYGGGPSAKYGGVFSHQYVQEVKLQRITLATHTSCRL